MFSNKSCIYQFNHRTLFTCCTPLIANNILRRTSDQMRLSFTAVNSRNKTKGTEINKAKKNYNKRATDNEF